MDHSIVQKKFIAVLAMAFMLALSIALPTNCAFADDGTNEAGAKITVTDPETGSLEFTIITPAGEDGAFGEVSLTNGYNYTGEYLELGSVYQDIGEVRYSYYVTSVGFTAFRVDAGGVGYSGNTPVPVEGGNPHIKHVVFLSSLSDPSTIARAVDNGAFCGCTYLEAVEFRGGVETIYTSAFEGCTALKSVTFPEGAEIKLIGAYAFRGCTALESIRIPAMPLTSRYGDAYYTAAEYNPLVPSLVNNTQKYTSSYSPWWHNGGAPVLGAGFGDRAFEGCTSLKTVVFEAGAPLGAYACFLIGGREFDGCTSLEAFVYEAEQAYAADPHGSAHNGSYTDYFANSARPDLYYAVDYYASTEAPSDDYRASNRIARVELKRDTPVSSIGGSSPELVDWAYPHVEDYYQKEGDGEIPDPNAVAASAGLDTGTQWAWKLTNTQSRRAGLTDSCDAYLVPANDISAGRVEAEQMTTYYERCDGCYSKGFIQDCVFDPYRYYWDSNTYIIDGGNVYFELESAVEQSFFGQMEIVSACGDVLDLEDFAVSFQRYDEDKRVRLCYSDSTALVASRLGETDGPLLMTITPSQESGYTGVLQEWVFVRGHAGSVRECYTDDAAATALAAVYSNGMNTNAASSFKGMPYSVGIGSQDIPSALMAAGYAGLVGAPICVSDTQDDGYGFTIGTQFTPSGRITGGAVNYGRANFDTLAAYSAAAYDVFNEKRASVGAPAEEYPWGDTAVLVAPASVNDVAVASSAYAYMKKAPVFFLNDDGSLDDAVLACLSDFENVVIMGDESCVSEEAKAAIDGKLGSKRASTRICGDERSAYSCSLAVAEALVSEGLASQDAVAIVDAADPIDALGALNFASANQGILLASTSTAESKAIASYLRERRDSVYTIRLFGRDAQNTSSDSFDLLGSLSELWSDDFEQPAIGAGDTLTLSGARFLVASDDGMLEYSESLWPHESIPSGTYQFEGGAYILKNTVDAFGIEDGGSQGGENNEGNQGHDGGANNTTDPEKPSSIVWFSPFDVVPSLSLTMDEAAADKPSADSNPGAGSEKAGNSTATSGQNDGSAAEPGGNSIPATPSADSGNAAANPSSGAQSQSTSGTLTVGNASSQSGGTLSTGTSASGSGSANRTLSVSYDPASGEDEGASSALNRNGDSANQTDNNATGTAWADTPYADSTKSSNGRANADADSDSAATNPSDASGSGNSAISAGFAVAAIVLALCGAVGYALRRRDKAFDLDMDE